MTDDMFDLGDPADDPDESESNSGRNDDNSGADTTAGTGSNDTESSQEDIDHGSAASEPADPKRTPAFDAEYTAHQHTIAAQDATWRDLTDLLEDARAHSKLDGYANVTRFEAYEALCRHVLTEVDPQDIATLIEETRHENLS
jgi:hypothetical protein